MRLRRVTGPRATGVNNERGGIAVRWVVVIDVEMPSSAAARQFAATCGKPPSNPLLGRACRFSRNVRRKVQWKTGNRKRKTENGSIRPVLHFRFSVFCFPFVSLVG